MTEPSDQTAQSETGQSEPVSKPLVVWDGDCGFCKRSVEYLKKRLAGSDADVDFQTYQSLEESPDGLSDRQFARAVHFIRPDGTWSSGAEAIFEALALTPDGGLGKYLYLNFPGFASVTEFGYELVADNRPTVSRWTRRWIGEELGPHGFQFTRQLFVRAIGLIFLIAFISFAVQWSGLIGSDGILPAQDRWTYLTNQPDASFFEYPSVFWLISPTDAVIRVVWIVGAAASVVVMLGWIPIPALALCWCLYLSLIAIGGPFFSFQWDALLLESALVAALLSPICLSLNGESANRRVSRAAILVGWWLIFRLYFMSGVVKLLSGDPVWHNLTALEYHFWTQPLPTWTAYYAAGLPDHVLSVLTAGMFVVEMAIPFMFFAPRRMRHVAAAIAASLQIGILATGNYGFFNLLALGLCALMVDDAAWRRLLPDAVLPDAQPTTPMRSNLRRALLAILAVGIVGLSGTKMAVRFSSMSIEQPPYPETLKTASRWSGVFDGFRTINNYGLFADMTVKRPELLVEGSQNGENWRRYDFRWKPDAPDDVPRYMVPHMPRLDWRMWFAALRGCGSGWYGYLQRALLQGRSDVEALFKDVPFENPPRYLRTQVKLFEFADGDGSGGSDGDAERWWKVRPSNTACPVVTLRNGKLRRVK